jgi:capsule polysaccharide export protein KpsE/RkpR
MQTKAPQEPEHVLNANQSSPFDGQPNGSRPEAYASVSFLAMFRILSGKKLQFGVVALAIFLLVSAVAFILPATYTATSSFIPPQNASGGLSSLANQLSSVGVGAGATLGAVKSNGDLYVGMLSSHTIADKLVTSFHLMEVYQVEKESQAIKRLAAQTNFELGVRDGIVTIRVTDRDPQRARDLANAYMEELHSITDRLALSESAQRRLFFEQQLAREKDRLADAEVALKQVQEKTGLVAPAGQTQVGLTTIAQTRAAIASRQVQLAGLRFSATEQDPQVVQLHDEIAELQSQLAGLRKGAGPSGSIDVPESNVPQVELEYVRQAREVKYHEALFDMISKQYEAARLDESHESPMLQVLDVATVPDSKSGPPKAIIIVAGFFLGLSLALLYILVGDRTWYEPAGRSLA